MEKKSYALVVVACVIFFLVAGVVDAGHGEAAAWWRPDNTTVEPEMGLVQSLAINDYVGEGSLTADQTKCLRGHSCGGRGAPYTPRPNLCKYLNREGNCK
jgi:hypothetical protein